MRTLILLFAALVLAGCQRDPHAYLYTTSEPKTEDIIGTYVLDAYHLPSIVGSARPEVVVELHADGTFAATNVPPLGLHEPSNNFFGSLLSATGKWEKHTTGTLDPGNKRIWGIYLRTPDSKIEPASFTGDKAPYGLIFTIGDPDSGDAMILRRKH